MPATTGSGPKSGDSSNLRDAREDGPSQNLSPAAQRALAEAAQRRREAQSAADKEVGGRGGLEPTRYGDWEVKGLTSDF